MSQFPTVLQINVRLSEGGAAAVARTIHDLADDFGYRSRFAYGYGPHGRTSARHTQYDAIRLTPRWLVAANRTAYAYRGKELDYLPWRSQRELNEALSLADVVHLHAPHSYFISFSDFAQRIIRLRKPLVWTFHDQWALTGRCALPGSCSLWKVGCPTCPDMRAYPPGRVDRAKTRAPERRDTIMRLREAVPTRFVACAAWLAQRAEAAGVGPTVKIANSVDPEYWKLASQAQNATKRPMDRRWLFVNRDLRDEAKVDWSGLSRIAQMYPEDLTVVGDHPRGPISARVYPAINQRQLYWKLLSSHEELIFTSRVDHYPLTVAEAVTAGLTVRALDSPGTREFLHTGRVALYKDMEELTEGLSQAVASRDFDVSYYAPKRMVSEYVSLYGELVHG